MDWLLAGFLFISWLVSSFLVFLFVDNFFHSLLFDRYTRRIYQARWKYYDHLHQAGLRMGDPNVTNDGFRAPEVAKDELYGLQTSAMELALEEWKKADAKKPNYLAKEIIVALMVFGSMGCGAVILYRYLSNLPY
ncbi:MAG: hypothetical protein JWM56_1095 [Candidatus Peribacteria bacterium]|nr:hypothetical protein [Candidatus Peribacteria bacterium]